MNGPLSHVADQDQDGALRTVLVTVLVTVLSNVLLAFSAAFKGSRLFGTAGSFRSRAL
jgi:hypothetical protein